MSNVRCEVCLRWVEEGAMHYCAGVDSHLSDALPLYGRRKGQSALTADNLADRIAGVKPSETESVLTALTDVLAAWYWMHPHGTAYPELDRKVRKAHALVSLPRDREARATIQIETLMLRYAGAMEIAEGKAGWEKIPLDCPMMGAVAALRRKFDRLSSPQEVATPVDIAIDSEQGTGRSLPKAFAAAQSEPNPTMPRPKGEHL